MQFGEGFIWLPQPSHTLSVKEAIAETSGRNREAGTKAESTKKCWLQAHFPWLAQLDFLYNLGQPSSRIPPTPPLH